MITRKISSKYNCGAESMATSFTVHSRPQDHSIDEADFYNDDSYPFIKQPSDFHSDNPADFKVKATIDVDSTENEPSEPAMALMVTGCKQSDLNGLFVATGHQNGHLLYNECIHGQAVLYWYVLQNVEE